jgi:hypothetical protein
LYQNTMKKLMITLPITVVTAAIFGAILAASIGTSESVYAQTNATNTTNTTNNNATGVESASQIENLTGDNTGLLQNSSDIASPSTGLTQGLEKEQTADTGGNMTAADKTAGQNATTAGGGGGANATTAANNTTAGQNATTAGQNATTAGGGGGANATTAANNTSGNQTSSENKTGNPLSNVPIIGQFFK